MRKLRKYTAAEYASASGSVVNPSLVLVDGEVKPGGNIAISDETNKPLMDALRANNVIASNKTYLTVEEAGQITSLPNFALFSTGITSMEELRFFTGMTTWGIQIAGENDDPDSLVKFALPLTITGLTSQSFQSRTFVKKIVIPDKSKYGNGVTSLPDRCIKQNYSLRFLSLPSTLRSIANDNFNRLGWRGSDTIINSNAFIGDTPCALTVICKAIVPPTVNATNNSFFTHSSGYDYTGVLALKIYVPDEAVNAYKSATWWTQYSSYIFPLSLCPMKFYDFFDDYFYRKPYDAEIEYLEGTAGTFIDTEIPGQNTMKIDTVYSVSGWTRYAPIYGNYVNEQTKCIRAILSSSDNNGGYIFVGQQSANGVGAPGLGRKNADNHIIASSTGITINGSSVNPPSSYNGNENSTNIVIFANNASLSPSGDIGLRMKSFKMINNDIVLRDFIPVRVGNVGYMYDKVSGALFGNGGTGDFVLGPDK